MEHIESTCSLELELFFVSTCSVGICTRIWDKSSYCRTSESETENQNPKTLDDYDEDEVVSKSSKWPPTRWPKQHKIPSGSRYRQSRPSINGRAEDATIFNLTTSCVVFVHHVGGHFGDHLDHHSKHLHSVHGANHIFFSSFFVCFVTF